MSVYLLAVLHPHLPLTSVDVADFVSIVSYEAIYRYFQEGPPYCNTILWKVLKNRKRRFIDEFEGVESFAVVQKTNSIDSEKMFDSEHFF